MKVKLLVILTSCLILSYLIYSKYLDGKHINEFIANCKNNEYCIKDLSGVRISARGPMYWINIEKNIHYTLLFREDGNGEIMLDDSLCWNDLSGLTNKQNVPNSFLGKVKTELTYYKNLIHCFNTLAIAEANGRSNILELFYLENFVIYYINDINNIESHKKNWLTENTKTEDNHFFWFKKNSKSRKSIWEAK